MPENKTAEKLPPYEAWKGKDGRWKVGYKDTPRRKYLLHHYYDTEDEARQVAREWNEIEGRTPCQ